MQATQKDTAEFRTARQTAEPVPLAPIARLLLRPHEAAAALGISSRLLWSLAQDGTIPAIRLRRTVRYSPTTLARWIKQQKETNG